MSSDESVSSVNVPKLVAAWRSGDQEAANQIFHKYQSRLILLVSGKLNERLRKRLDAEDLVQSIMRSAFRVTAQKDLAFQDETGFWKWLTTVALNKTYNRIDRETTKIRDPDREAGGDSTLVDHMQCEPTPDDVTEVEELLELILARLTKEQGQILLGRLDGKSHAEIADELKVSTKTIQRNSQAIRDAAMAVLGRDAPDWLLPPEPTPAMQFLDCLSEPISNWLPKDHSRASQISARSTLREHLFSNTPELDMIDGIRSAAKERGSQKDAHQPPLVCVAIYLLAIAAARLRLNQRISSDSDEKLRARVQLALQQPWLDSRSKATLEQLLQHCRA